MAARNKDPQRQSETEPSRYVVGIDLGTTNSAVAYVDTESKSWQVRVLAVPQLVAPGQVESRETLPSFHYQPTSRELPAGSLRLPWSTTDPEHAVGFFARDHGAAAPGRLIASAKSWLSHAGVDRTAELLPWHGAADVERLSPIDASARYLRHIHDAWNHQFPKYPLAKQDVVLTLPASFDEVARELTVEAAARAGLPRVVLIEEPQAAFYAWVYKHADDWEQYVEPGQKILVCDIGGGTSDFTLIRVRRGEQGKVQFHRVAVGDHLILGGDNFDLALAQHVEQRLAGAEGAGGKLEPRQWENLVRACRRAKESLLCDDAPQQLTLNLPASGARLIGGGLQVEVTRDEVRDLLCEGFLPRVALDERPAARRSGFQEFGLPYAPDPAITRNLAAFLSTHRHVALDDTEVAPGHDPARPDVIIFNGGVFASALLRERLLAVVQSWFSAGESGPWQPIVLDNDRLDLAVARGAAYYGMVLRGEGVRIAANLARTYYIGVESDQHVAVCLLPGTAEPGQDVDLQEPTFSLLVSEPVEFPLYVSSTRLTDQPGQIVPVDDEQMKSLPPIRTVLRTRKRREAGTVAVTLHARLTEIGTVDMWCSDVDQQRSWRLQFDIRSATQTDIAAHETAGEREGFVDEATWQQCQSLIEATFVTGGPDKPEGLVKRLAKATEMQRNEWPTSLLRRIWEALIENESGRRRSPSHESRWLNLLGFCLRPGYGLAVDDWRVAETWRLVQGKLAHGAAACRTESWVLWRRIAGGLSSGQQRAVAEPLLGPLRTLHRRATGAKKRTDVSFTPQESTEIWRLLGSLELLPVELKIEMGSMLLDLIPKKSMQPVRGALAWALGRLAARVPLYGPLNVVVPIEHVGDWLDQLLAMRVEDPTFPLAAMQMARRTDDRYRDLGDKRRGRVLEWLENCAAPAHFVQLVREGGVLDSDEQDRVFGEALPKGLRIA